MKKDPLEIVKYTNEILKQIIEFLKELNANKKEII